MSNIVVTGIAQAIKGVDQRVKAVRMAVDRGVVATAGQIQRKAILSISSEPSQGREYTKKGGKKHIASRPGDAPNTDTGSLVKSIAVSHKKGSKVAYVFTDLDYGAYLELIKDRPWLRPAMEAKQDQLEPNIKREVDKVI